MLPCYDHSSLRCRNGRHRRVFLALDSGLPQKSGFLAAATIAYPPDTANRVKTRYLVAALAKRLSILSAGIGAAGGVAQPSYARVSAESIACGKALEGVESASRKNVAKIPKKWLRWQRGLVKMYR
jgi:hypothetical protein